MDRVISSPDTPVKNPVEVELEDWHGHTALDPLDGAVHRHAVWTVVQLREQVDWVLHLNDLIHEEGGLPLGLLVGNVQEPPDVALVVGGVMLWEEVSQEALCHVPHLGAVPSEGNRRLGSRELLKDHTGHITQPGPLSLKLGIDDKKYLNMG